MACADSNPNRHVADAEITDSVNAGGVLYTEPRYRLSDDALTLFDGERFKRFVLEVPNLKALVVIPDETFKRAEATASGVSELGTKRRFVNSLVAETETTHD